MQYQDLIVWQKAMELVEKTYALTKILPREEIYGIDNQMRRAAVSIPSNIAEGKERNSDKEFAHLLSIARGSKAELETQFLICVKLGYYTKEQVDNVLELCADIGKMLSTLILKVTG